MTTKIRPTRRGGPLPSLPEARAADDTAYLIEIVPTMKALGVASFGGITLEAPPLMNPDTVADVLETMKRAIDPRRFDAPVKSVPRPPAPVTPIRGKKKP